MQYWLLKTEPSSYSFGDLQRAGRAVWDGVANAVALRNLRSMEIGDLALIYHTGDEKAAVRLTRVVSAPYPDPKAGDPKLTVVELAAEEPLPQPVTLAQVKADPECADFALVRQGRLSVVPVPPAIWRKLLAWGGAPSVRE